MSAKKRVVRRRPITPAPEPEPEPEKKPRKRKPTESAWVRLGRPSASCACGKVHVELEGTDLVIHGPGWIKENQWACCGHCNTMIRFSPRILWERPSGDRYSTRGYLGEDAPSRKVEK